MLKNKRMNNRDLLMVTAISGLMSIVAIGWTMSLTATNTSANDNPKSKSAGDLQQEVESEATSAHEQPVFGTVVSDDGTSVANLTVVLVRQDGRDVRSVQADERGRFATPIECWKNRYFSNELVGAIVHDPNRRLGWFRIRASEADDRRDDGDVVRISAPGPMPFDLHLLPLNRVVIGQVLGPNRQPISQVRIQTVRLGSAVCGDINFHKFDTRHELPIPSAMTDETGRFRILLPGGADLELSVLHPDWIMKNIHVMSDDNLGEILLRPSAKLSGRIIMGDTGNPASGILVFADWRSALRGKAFRRIPDKLDPDADLGWEGACITDTEGKYEIGGLRDEPHYIEVDTTPLGREFVVPSGEVKVIIGQTEVVDLVISRGRRVSGQVCDADSGETVSDVEVHWNVTRPKEPSWSFGSGLGRTNEQGEFEFFALPGHCQIEAGVNPRFWRKVAQSRVVVAIGDVDSPPVELKIQQVPADVIEPRAVWRMHFGDDLVSSFVFQSDSKIIITGGSRLDLEIEDEKERWRVANGDLRLWDVATGEQVTRFGHEPGRIMDVTLSPNDKLIVTAIRLPDDGGLVRVWNRETQQLVMNLIGHEKAVLSVDVSSDGRLIASGSWDKTARIWDIATGNEVFKLKHNWSPDCLQFSPDGKLLATAGTKGEIKFWDVATGAEVVTFEDNTSWVQGLSWSRSGNSLAITSVTCNSDGRSISSDSLGIIRLLSVTRKPGGVRIIERRKWGVEGIGSDIAFSPDGTHVADARHVARVWRVPSGKDVVMISQSTSTSSDRISFSPDGKILAIGGHAAVVLWDVTPLITPEVAN